MEKLEFNIPKGYVIDKEKSTETKLVFEAKEDSSYHPTYVDFSIHNPNDWFFVKTASNNWIVKSEDVPYKLSDNTVQYSIESNGIYTQGLLCSKNSILEYRKATEKEIKEMYKHIPYLNNNPKWEDFGAVSGYYVSSFADIGNITNLTPLNSNKNTFPSEKEAEACLALSQLLQWRDKYNKEPLEKWCNWNAENQTKYSFKYTKHRLEKVSLHLLHHPLCFKNCMLRDKFMENFKELIEVAKPLL